MTDEIEVVPIHKRRWKYFGIRTQAKQSVSENNSKAFKKLDPVGVIFENFLLSMPLTII